MSTFSLQVTYRRGSVFAAYIYLARTPGQKSARTEEVTPDLLVDYAADGRPIGIEIITPEAVKLEDISRTLERLGFGRPAPRELAPLWAA